MTLFGLDVLAALKVGRAIYGAAGVAETPLKERVRMGRRLTAALAYAVCPTAATREDVRKAAKKLRRALRKTPVPDEPRISGWVSSAKAKAEGVLEGKRPDVDTLEGPEFDARMEAWIGAALKSSHAQGALDGVECNGERPTAEDIAKRFLPGFYHDLDTQPDAYSTALLTKLATNHLARPFRQAKAGWAAAALGLPATFAGAGAGIGADVAGVADWRASLIGLGVAAAGAAATIAARRGSRQVTDAQLALRAAVRGWLGDLLEVVYGCKTQESSPDALLAALSSLISSELLRLEQGKEGRDGPRGPSRPEDVEELMRDLAGRLIPHARAEEDEEVLAALIEAEDLLVRWRRSGFDFDRAQELYGAVLDVIVATSE